MNKLLIFLWFATNVYTANHHPVRWHVWAEDERQAVRLMEPEVFNNFGKDILWGWDEFIIEEIPIVELKFYIPEVTK